MRTMWRQVKLKYEYYALQMKVDTSYKNG